MKQVTTTGLILSLIFFVPLLQRLSGQAVLAVIPAR